MRDGPLANDVVQLTLKENFISSWSLIVYLEDILANSSVKQEVKDILKRTMDAYEFPVQSMIMRPDTGDIVHVINANRLMEIREEQEGTRVSTDPLAYSYNSFLLEGLRKAREEQPPTNPE